MVNCGRREVFLLEIDFDKILNDYLDVLKTKNPNPDDDFAIKMHLIMMNDASRVCIQLIKRYHEEVQRLSQQASE
jgi:hypothetical protein